ncbi:hypothetical protein KSP40_PGU008246 [Platanthera guangdongensis]|uniref:C3H1-type domain-containing protein n=1 Tax=Platanthera guangdongensis TaxID=2320717 RepID=A0ABR2MAQ2_9ASPA
MEFDDTGGFKPPIPRPAVVVVTEASASSSLVAPLDQESMWQMRVGMGESMIIGSYPEHPGEPDCTYYLRTGLCRYGITCRFNHPPNRNLAMTWMKGGYPERVGLPDCQYYLKTGTCKFGPTCKFHHPKDTSGIIGRAQLNVLNYPLRPNEKECAYYLRTGVCKFGDTCKFHHPEPSSAMLSSCGSLAYPSAQSPTTPGQPSFTWALRNGTLSRCSGLSSYPQLVLPQGLVQVPSWNSFPGQFGSSSSPESQQKISGNSQFYEKPHQRETCAGSSASFSSFGFGSIPIGQYTLQAASIFPDRPGELECQFYMKTGDCKFGAACRFHHPSERLLPAPNCMMSPLGLPLRPGEPLCIYYSRHSVCKFGPNCKFDHPVAAPIGVFAYNPSTGSSSSHDLRVACRPLGSLSGPPALTLSSNGSLEVGPSESRRLSPSDLQQMDSGDVNVGSE